MSLIITYINKFGIVTISDSNLSSRDGNSGFGQKIFPIPYLNANLSYVGSYTIDSTAIDNWMNTFISETSLTIISISDFVDKLSNKLSTEMRENEIENPTIIHVAGFIKTDNNSHAVFWHISNCIIQKDGSYGEISTSFSYSNDFNSLTNSADRNNLIEFDKNPLLNHWFINGYPPGRITHTFIKDHLDPVFYNIWKVPDWKFREPRNIFESAEIYKFYFQLVIKLFTLSDYPAMFIGGEIQTHLIPAPNDLLKIPIN